MADTQLDEQRMQTQQLMDDADLRDLKEKLKNIKDTPKPSDKD